MNNKKDKLIPFEAWKAARMIEENLHMGIQYQSFVGGIEEKPREDLRYFMVVYSTPAEECADEEYLYDSEETELFTVIRDKGVGEFRSLDDRGIERYEIYDVNSDDVHIMYRVPYRPPYPRLVKDK